MATRLNSSSDERQAYETSRRGTLLALEKIDDSTLLQLTRLTLPEIQALREEIARVLPVGNLPAFILDGLTKLKSRLVNAARVKRDLTALFQGTNIVPQGLYGAFIAGPATVLYAYQKLLQLAGKDLETAFPEGTWQFYLQFGVREDTGRHANETVGFHRAIPEPQPVSAAAAWVATIADFVLSYDNLLAADWSERVSLRLLLDVAAEMELNDEPPFKGCLRAWNAKRPYVGPSKLRQPDQFEHSAYLSHRNAVFKVFLNERLAQLSPKAQRAFRERYQARAEAELSDYQTQMSLLAYLEPDRFQETRQPVPVWRAQVGFIWGGRVYLIPVCQQDERGQPLCYPTSSSGASPMPLREVGGSQEPGEGLVDSDGQPLIVNRWGRVWSKRKRRLVGQLRPLPLSQIKGHLATIIDQAGSTGQRPAPKGPPLDLLLVGAPRALQAELRAELPPETQAEIARLRQAPVILNWDLPQCDPSTTPLPYIRRGQRGIGDHALTLFRTQRGFIFDQSHIFFDGLWGMAVAEILTNRAIQLYHQSVDLSPQLPARIPQPLALNATPEFVETAKAKRLPGEAAAQNDEIDTQALSQLRHWLDQRGVRLTVNDLLLLYRYFHAHAYQPSLPARQAIEAFRQGATSPEAKAAIQALDESLVQMRTSSPALLIPMDASNVAPRERVFPTTFHNPLTDVQERMATTYQSWQTYQARPGEGEWTAFDQARRELLAYLKAFGELLNALKAVTMRGESFNTASIRLLAHLPPSMQHLLDQIPQRIGVLNEIVKGNEVFSNVGRVASGSSLSRFCSARDDGQTKQLVWGVLTDDEGVMHVSLRDYRPFVPLLLQLQDPAAQSLADRLARDYLQAYVDGFNQFVGKLSDIVRQDRPQ